MILSSYKTKKRRLKMKYATEFLEILYINNIDEWSVYPEIEEDILGAEDSRDALNIMNDAGLPYWENYDYCVEEYNKRFNK